MPTCGILALYRKALAKQWRLMPIDYMCKQIGSNMIMEHPTGMPVVPLLTPTANRCENLGQIFLLLSELSRQQVSHAHLVHLAIADWQHLALFDGKCATSVAVRTYRATSRRAVSSSHSSTPMGVVFCEGGIKIRAFWNGPSMINMNPHLEQFF